MGNTQRYSVMCLKRSYILAGVLFTFSINAPAQPNAAQDIQISDARAVPAETLATGLIDANWARPQTSWGVPSFEGVWSTDDMRGIPLNRPETFGERESLTPAEFRQRAARAEAGMDRAVNTETFLRSEWGVRAFGYSSLVVDPANGRIPPMTEAGRARAGSRDRGTFGPGPFNAFTDFTLYDRCVTRGVIGSILPVIYGNGLRITQSPGYFMISYEMIHDTRIIPLDNRATLPGDIRQWMGSARGRWEGDTLVVETTNFTDETSIGTNGNGTRHSDQLKITETFTRVDPQMIQYTATIDDPVTYRAPFTLRMMITQQPNYQTYEYSCHEGNGAVGHSLSGERAYEQQVAEALAAGRPAPTRSGGNIFGAPEEGAEIFNINAGE